MIKFSLYPILFFYLITNGFSQEAILLDENSPIIVNSQKKHVKIFEDKNENLNIDDFVNSTLVLEEFSGELLDSRTLYWIKQDIISNLDTPREIDLRINGDIQFIDNIEIFIIKENKVVDVFSRSPVARNLISASNPYEITRNNYLFYNPSFYLEKNSKATIFFKVKPYQLVNRGIFSSSFVDSKAHSEFRRFGLYLEGSLFGAILALGVFGWFSALKNKDKTSLTYAIWILFGLLSIGTLVVHDGSRYSEFFDIFHIDNFLLSFLPSQIFFLLLFGYGQAFTYLIFARNYLEIKYYFPKLYITTNIGLLIYILSFTFGIFVENHNVHTNIYFLVPASTSITMLLIIYWCAFKRWRGGMSIAAFFMVAMVPYFFFRSLFLFGIAGIPSPLTLLPDEGFGLFMKDTNLAQSIGISCEALIMALAVVARTRYLQDELAINLKKQNELTANQNKILEATVAERTKELSEKHEELNKEHQVVTESINYAQIIQNGQLPRDHRVEGRFKSFYSFWEPRDKIGGDLWWVSTTRVKGEFALAVADCTGHGVPGAMLALLVSSSLEQIYSTDNKTSTHEAIKSLDYLTRVGLNQDNPEAQSNDGCDAAIIKIEPQKNKLYFTGAKLDLFKLSKNNTTKYSANRISLGYKEPLDEEPVEIVIDYHEGDTFVVVTDGLTDQIGEKERKSYGYKRIENILNNNSKANAEEIGEKLKDDFLIWQGNEKRRDDVTFIAFTL